MSVTGQVKQDYDKAAGAYAGYNSLPSGQLGSQLIGIALGNLGGLTVLDLGGGSGVHAREATDLGAAAVDIVDISPGMLKIAHELEESLAGAIPPVSSKQTSPSPSITCRCVKMAMMW
jgi:ubiquinone/menaquinone biosynthesis C-methylase UbiE